MQMMKRLMAALLLLAMLLGAAACAPASQTAEPTPTPAAAATPTPAQPSETQEPEFKTIKNVDGTDISVPVKVEKIGAIFGPSYEKVVMLGAEDKIVFNGDFHINGWPWSNVIYKYLNGVPGIPNAHSELNIEDLMGYEPDLVFNFPNQTTTDAMRAAGISVVPSASTGKLEDIKSTVKVYAEAIGGDAVGIAERYAEYFDNIIAKVTAIAQTVPEGDKPKVYFANQEILFTAGNKSDINEIITLVGGIPAAAEVAGGSKTEVTKEQFIAWAPDYIFIDHAGSSGNATAEEVVAQMVADADYADVPAIKNDRVIIVPTGVFFWDSGVQKPLLVLLMAKTLYPEAYADIDIKAELVSFYSEFFHYDLTDDQADRILAHLDPA